MKLKFWWRGYQAGGVHGRLWQWRVDATSGEWTNTADDTTTGTITWLRRYLR